MSKACSASIKAALPPAFWASAIQWRANVVLPEDSGPYISEILPLGMPPIPKAASRLSEPVEIASMLRGRESSPIYITDPFPNWRSIWAIATSKAFKRSSFAMIFILSVFYYYVPILHKLSMNWNKKRKAFIQFVNVWFGSQNWV